MKKLFAFKLAINGLFDGIKAVFTVNTLWRPLTADLTATSLSAVDPACAAVNYFSVTSDAITWSALTKPSSKKHLPL